MTNDCTFRQQLSAYHDGERSPDASARVDEHLAGCEPCRVALASIQQLSDLFASARDEDVTLAEVARVHDAIDAEPAGNYFRTARMLIGLAASVLIIGSAWLWETPAGVSPVGGISISTGQTPQWEYVAVNQQAWLPPNSANPVVGDESRYAEAEVIQYMVQNLSRGPVHGNP